MPSPAGAWYEEWFDRDEYELVYNERDLAEAARVVNLLERAVKPETGAAILDVGCGRGRHARTLARRGYRVAGIDLSARAIETARRRAAEEGLEAIFAQQDMREPFCTGCVGGAVNLFSSFGYFEDERDHARALGAVVTALRPGGWFFQDFMNAPHVRATLVPEDERRADGHTIRQRRWIADGRINKEITLRPDRTGGSAPGVQQNGGPQNGDAKTFRESVRLLTLEDFQRLYAEAGLELVQTFGGYDGRPHTDSAPRLILHARTP